MVIRPKFGIQEPETNLRLLLFLIKLKAEIV